MTAAAKDARDAAMSLSDARRLLGVGRTADQADVRRAFREAAKQHHPDRAGGTEEAFRQVVEAYQRLQRRQPNDFAPPGPAAGDLAVSPRLAAVGGNLDYAAPDGRRLRLTLPPGLRVGDRVRAGEAMLRVTIPREDGVTVRGDDIWIDRKVTSRVLALGGRITVETPFGRRSVWVTKTAGELRLLRLPGLGLPARGERPQGHLFVNLSLAEHEGDNRARALLRRFAASWAA